MSHKWLHTPDCKVSNEMTGSSFAGVPCTTYLAECGQKRQQVLPNLLFHIHQAAPQQLNRPAVSSLL